MTPTPIPFVDMSQMVAGVNQAIAYDPTLPLFLVAAGLLGLAFYLTRRGKKAVR